MPGSSTSPSHDGITDIVEFHDCQQFIVRDESTGLSRYSSLFAIFARVFLDSAYKRPVTDSGPPFDPTVMGAPMATIFSYDAPYPALGLSRGFSCLYFFKHTVGTDSVYWSAKVVYVQERQEACAQPLPDESGPGTTLAVTRITNPGLTPADYPPVARWDRDPSSGLQYIGIRCEDAWCEVHTRMASGQLFTASAPLRFDTRLAKGWYDEQVLTSADVAPGGQPRVSDITGTFIPHPKLGELSGPEDVSAFAHGWREVATVGINAAPGGYTSKLNLRQSDGDGAPRNTVSLCYVTSGTPNRQRCFDDRTAPPKCDTPTKWYAKITSGVAPDTSSQFFCVTRRGHDAMQIPKIPGVVRWRWALDDETMWIRCLQGCCEVKPRV